MIGAVSRIATRCRVLSIEFFGCTLGGSFSAITCGLAFRSRCWVFGYVVLITDTSFITWQGTKYLDTFA